MKTARTTFDAETEFHRCSPMVTRIAKQFAARVPANVTFDDLVQAGLIGLLEASRRYDPTSGVPFEAFATPRIRGAMTDELREHDWMSRQKRRDLREVEDAARRLSQRLGRTPTQAEIARELDVPLSEVQDTVADADVGRPCIMPADEDSDADFLEERFASEGPDPSQQCSESQFRRDLAKSIGKLPERERMVMGLYYEQELNLREIAAVMDVTESRVCQIHRQAIERLQDSLSAWREPATKVAKLRRVA